MTHDIQNIGYTQSSNGLTNYVTNPGYTMAQTAGYNASSAQQTTSGSYSNASGHSYAKMPQQQPQTLHQQQLNNIYQNYNQSFLQPNITAEQVTSLYLQMIAQQKPTEPEIDYFAITREVSG